MYKRLFNILLLGFIILQGCLSSSIRMNVKSHYDPSANLIEKVSFILLPVSKEKPLLEKELLYMVKNKMIKKGYIYDEKNPDIIISILFTCEYTEWIGDELKYIPEKRKTTTGWVGGEYVTITEKEESEFKWKKVEKSGYYRNITIIFGDPDALIQKEEVKIIWKGVAESIGSSSDIRIVAPYLINEILGEFPIKSGKSVKRDVYMD